MRSARCQAADAVASNLGISGLATGDAAAQVKVLTAQLNTKGGLAGLPIQLHAGRIDAARAAPDSEGACAEARASLTQRSKVSYVVTCVNLSPSRLAC